MNFRKFLYIFASINILFIFLKIYQHNYFVRLSYSKQRLEAKLDSLNKEKDLLNIHFLNLKNQQKVSAYAKNVLNFKPIDSANTVQLNADSNLEKDNV